MSNCGNLKTSTRRCGCIRRTTSNMPKGRNLMPDKSFSNTLRFIRKVLPATASLLTSCGILYGAYSVYHRNDTPSLPPSPTTALPNTGAVSPHPIDPIRTHTRSSSGGSITPPAKTVVKSAKQKTSNETKTRGAETDNRSKAHRDSSTTESETAQNQTSKVAQTSRSDASQSGSTNSEPALTGTTQNSENIGFAPVQGGSIKLLAQAPKNAGTLSASVIQYGSLPETTSSGTVVKIPGAGLFTLPTLTSGTYLYLPLKHGVLWAVIPPTTESISGLVGEAYERTPIFYTAYRNINTAETLAIDNPQNGTTNAASMAGHPSMDPMSQTAQPSDVRSAAQANQTASANTATQSLQTTSSKKYAPDSPFGETELLGELPRTTPPTESWRKQSLSWFHPRQESMQRALQPFVQPGRVNTNSQAGERGARDVQLKSFYRIYHGALFVIAFHKDNQTLNEVVQWNTRRNTLTPLAWLPNGGDAFSWLAVSQSALYDEVRHVRKSEPTAFRGHQEYINLKTDHIHPIQLGHWSDGGVGAGKSLAFEVDDSSNWELFTPSSVANRLLSKNDVQTSH